MSYEENLRCMSFDADASVGIYTGVPGLPGSAVPNGGLQFRFVKLTGKNQVGLCVAGTDAVIGVLQNKPQRPGAACTVGYEGTTNIVAGATIAVGDLLVPDATGRGVPAGGTVSAAGAARLRAISPAAVGELVPALFVN
jgi:hypothetical protein